MWVGDHWPRSRSVYGCCDSVTRGREYPEAVMLIVLCWGKNLSFLCLLSNKSQDDKEPGDKTDFEGQTKISSQSTTRGKLIVSSILLTVNPIPIVDHSIHRDSSLRASKGIFFTFAAEIQTSAITESTSRITVIGGLFGRVHFLFQKRIGKTY